MVQIRQKITTLSPQPVLSSAGTPQRVATTSVPARSIILEAAIGNDGKIKIADTEAKASTVNSHSLSPGDNIVISSDLWGNVDAFLNLNDIWFDGAVAGDRLVVTYIIDETNPEE